VAYRWTDLISYARTPFLDGFRFADIHQESRQMPCCDLQIKYQKQDECSSFPLSAVAKPCLGILVCTGRRISVVLSRVFYCDESECCRIVQGLPTPLVPLSIFVAWLADASRRAAEAALAKIIGTLGAIVPLLSVTRT
jgi:hypothetical protein